MHLEPSDATTPISIWSNVEAGLGITAGSLVTLRPLFRWFRGSYYEGSKSRTYGRGGSMPLSSMNRGFNSRQEQPGNKYWRPDLANQSNQGVTTTIQTSRGSQNSSQEDLNPKQSSFSGVNVQKSFLVTTDEA